MLLLATTLLFQTAAFRSVEGPDPAIQTALDAIYAGVSHAPNEEPDWSIFNDVFLDGAIIVLPYQPGTAPELQTVSDFQSTYKKMLAQPRALKQGFFERCAGFEATIFGNVATVTSVYEAVESLDQVVPDRVGIDCVHLVKTKDGWKATSLITDFQRKDNPLPPHLATMREKTEDSSTTEAAEKAPFFSRLHKLVQSGHSWDPFLERANLHMGIYHLGAGAIDAQPPHSEDEIYYVVSGQSKFTVGDQEWEIETGDVLFVPATKVHRFHDIVEDLDLLVFFARQK